MKKQISIILFFLLATNLNIFAQANKLVTTTQKVMAEKAISEYCHYLEEIAQGKSAGLAILRNLYIEQFANETWDDIETNELISFDKYFQKLQNKSTKIHFTKIPTRSDFLYYATERKGENDNIIKVPFIAAPIEKTINGKQVKGYIFVRATTFQITNYKPKMPDWANIFNDNDKRVKRDILLFTISTNGKYGFFDKTGKTIIPFMYDFAGSFSEGLALVKKKEKWGFINKENKTIIPFIYDDAANFKEGLAGVNKNGKWGFIDKTGETIIPFIFDNASEFNEGVAGVEKDNKWGFINKVGDIVVPLLYNFPTPVLLDNIKSQNGFVALMKNGKWGFISNNGIVLNRFTYDGVRLFNEGYAAVKKNGKWGFMNTVGEIKIPFIYKDVRSFKEGLASVEIDEKWGAINRNGKIIIPIFYEYCGQFNEGLATIYINDKGGYINKQNKQIIFPTYKQCYDFSEGIASVKNENDKRGYINRKGEIIIPIKYDWGSKFYKGVALVRKEGRMMFINKIGEIIK